MNSRDLVLTIAWVAGAVIVISIVFFLIFSAWGKRDAEKARRFREIHGSESDRD